MDHLEKIIEGCKKNDPVCQEQLYNFFAAELFGLCLRYSRNYAEAQDVMQDGFIKIFLNIRQYQFKGSFEGWMKRIMINTALERYRKTNFLYFLDQNQESADVEVEDDVEANITADELLKMVQELPPQYRTVFNLYVIEGFAHQEISKMLGISEGTSKSNLNRARNILKEKILHQYGSNSMVISLKQ